jgi:hypothetical protein
MDIDQIFLVRVPAGQLFKLLRAQTMTDDDVVATLDWLVRRMSSQSTPRLSSESCRSFLISAVLRFTLLSSCFSCAASAGSSSRSTRQN